MWSLENAYRDRVTPLARELEQLEKQLEALRKKIEAMHVMARAA